MSSNNKLNVGDLAEISAVAAQLQLEAYLEAAVKGHQARIDSLVSYMQTKIEAKDWHAVADAAMDIRDAEAVVEFCKNFRSDL